MTRNRDRPVQACCGCCQVLAILVYAGLIAVRIPDILLKGRFWAEEAVVYFAAARQLPWYDALFLVHAGYLNVTAGLAALAATSVPLDHAPWVSTVIALLVQVLPAVLLITSEIPWLRRRWQMAAALLLLVVVQSTAELWMNTITSQFHLGLCAALILAMPVRGGWVGVVRGGVLVLAALSGPVACALAPLFLLRAFLDRSQARLIQTAVLGAASVVQVAMVVLHATPGRTFEMTPRLLALVIYARHIVLPTLGPIRTDAVAVRILEEMEAGVTPWGRLAVLALVTAALAWGAWASRDSAVRWLLLAAGTTMALSYIGMLGSQKLLVFATYGGRYGMLPSSLLSLAVFALSQTLVGLRRLPFVAVSIWVAIVGIIAYPQVDRSFAHGAAWGDEVAKLRADPTHFLQIWPDDPNWKLRVEPGR